MEIFSDTESLLPVIEKIRAAGKSIGFVPTMGALHKGHLTLVENSVRENDFTIVSVFVNPTQFNNAEDLLKYPRDLNRDAELLEQVGCDFVFAPEPADIYTADELNKRFDFDFQGLDTVMEGKFRPGHFNGVVQIVSKLFKLIPANNAYFGEKDFQQLAIIHLMVQTLKMDVNIVDCPIVREESGLAMSSRNERLSTEQRHVASRISAVLFESRKLTSSKSPSELQHWVVEQFKSISQLELEYFEIANANNLQAAKTWDVPTVGCVAVFCGSVRLIDNVRYN